MTTHVIMKTKQAQYRAVIRFAKHATDHPPRFLAAGAVVLIHCEAEGKTVPPRVTHAMDCVDVYPDQTGESKKIWGHQWSFIIEGTNLRRLPRPIPISRFGRASKKNYGKGAQKFVYVKPEDVEDLRGEGLL